MFPLLVNNAVMIVSVNGVAPSSPFTDQCYGSGLDPNALVWPLVVFFNLYRYQEWSTGLAIAKQLETLYSNLITS